MISGKKVVVVMPAYNAEKTLHLTWEELPHDLVDEVVLVVDDASGDSTIQVAQELGIQTIQHPENMGYGANQKTCYGEALRREANIGPTASRRRSFGTSGTLNAHYGAHPEGRIS